MGVTLAAAEQVAVILVIKANPKKKKVKKDVIIRNVQNNLQKKQVIGNNWETLEFMYKQMYP